MFQVTLSIRVLEVVDASEVALAPKRASAKAQPPARGFRPFGDVSSSYRLSFL